MAEGPLGGRFGRMPVGSLAACLRSVPLAASIFSWALNPYAHVPASILPVSHTGPEEALEDEGVEGADDAHEPAKNGAMSTQGFESTPAMRYGALDRAGCEREVKARNLAWQPIAGEARGVLIPGRLTGPLHGVSYHSGIPASQRATSAMEIVDCRLALALDDFAQILGRYGVVEVIHLSAYRPPPSRGWTPGRLGKRHGAAMAMDMGLFKRADGTTLSVLKDFHGAIGSKTCGPHAGPWPQTPEALTLRKIACETADAHLFNVELTPDFNRAHNNHFHLEVSPHARWFYLR